jgi:hypothetical protein
VIIYSYTRRVCSLSLLYKPVSIVTSVSVSDCLIFLCVEPSIVGGVSSFDEDPARHRKIKLVVIGVESVGDEELEGRT